MHERCDCPSGFVRRGRRAARRALGSAHESGAETMTDATPNSAEAAALAEPNVRRAIGDKTIRKVIVVPEKVINVVV